MRVSPEKEALLRAARPAVQRVGHEGRRQAGVRGDEGRELGRHEAAIAAGPRAAGRLVAGRLVLGAAAQPAGRQGLCGRHEPLDRAHAAGHRHVGADGPGARLAEEADLLRDILRLATAPDGWAAAGKPEYGRFKYVHTNPDSSTSGAEAVAGSYYAFVGKQEGLTEADVATAAPKVKALERAIVHYGDSTLFIEDELCKGGLGYASARGDGGGDGDRLQPPPLLVHQARRALPHGGVVRQRLAVHRAPCALGLAAKAAAARRSSASWPSGHAGEGGAGGFRSGDETARPAGLVSAPYGADPSQPKRTLTLPTPHVVNTLLQTWRRDRKPADVELILDNSGSMADEDKLEHAKAGLQAFFKQVAPQDEIGLAKFSDKVTQLVPPAPFRSKPGRASARVRRHHPRGRHLAL
jgi:Ca-activated chloride channel family protein